SAVDRITPVQKPSMGDSSVISIELREAVAYTHEQLDDLIRVHFDASSVPPRPFEEAKLPAWKEILTRTEIPEIEEDEEPDEEKPRKADATELYGDDPITYTGEKIALDFYETDIKNVFRILREVSGKNFAIDKNVKGRVTLTLEKPVPWDQVLALVLKMNQLGMIYEGDIIRIATLQTIKREDQEKQRRIKAKRKARAEQKKLTPLETRFFSINYSSARREIAPHIRKILSRRGKISVDNRNNQIILTDLPEVIVKARELIQKIDQVTPQVIIEARIVEVNSEFSKELGISWSLEGGIQPDDEKAGIGPQRGYDALGGTYGYMTAMNFPSAGDSGFGFNFTKIFGSPLVINAVLNAAESQAKAKVLSSPKILTMDNKKAMIKQGLEVAYKERDSAGGSSVKFKKVDLLLVVKPSITPDNR
ncbi:MAG: type IV pilus secretin PilQ, partial [Desulfobacterales bacterium]|nr:type IV pilus secretin PilQ [Desulfobacterales bacterium]